MKELPSKERVTQKMYSLTGSLCFSTILALNPAQIVLLRTLRSLLPDITEIVLRARTTRTVRIAVKFAMFGAIVIYLWKKK